MTLVVEPVGNTQQARRAVSFSLRGVAITAVVAGLLLVSVLVWQRAQPVVHALDGWAMGSSWSVRVVGPRDLDTAALKAGLEAQLQRLDQQLSGYRVDTALSRVNAAPVGTWVEVPTDLATVLKFGIDLWDLSAGAFDMTVRPLVLLWGFGAAEARKTVPTQQEIAASLAALGSDRMAWSADGVRLQRLSDVTIDVDAIAPGHTADVLAAWLAQQGLHDALVDVGGELMARGHRPDGSKWHVGIERPVMARGDVARRITVSDMAVATSGDYRDYFELAGRRYAHTLNPVTGWPVDHGLASVTVLAPTALKADGYATALMVMGPVEGMIWAEKHQLPVFMIIRTGKDSFIERYNDLFAPALLD